MGLDQYLLAESFISGYSHAKMEDKIKYDQIVESIGMDSIASPAAPHVTVSVNVAYWRKANQIHGWFVKNVQKGKDDCERYYVETPKLKELLEVCKKVMNSRFTEDAHQTAADLLPPSSGFFFGSGVIDSGYYDDVQYTIDTLTKILNYKGEIFHMFYYQASW